MDAPTTAAPDTGPPEDGRVRPLPWFVPALLWLVVLALVLGGARLAYYSKSRFSQQLQQLQSLQEAFKETAVLMGLVVEMEKGQRDFLLAREDAALQAYRDAAAQLPAQVSRLQSMLRGRAELQQRLQQLQRISEQELQDLASLQAVTERRGRAEALALAQREGAAPGMDSSRAAVANLQMDMVDIAIREQEALHEVIARRNLAIYLTILLGAAAAGGALFLLRRQYLTLREEQVLRARVVESQHASLQKSNFLANVSHEIRTPMNAILGFSQLLLERVGDSVSRRYVEAITVSGRSLLALIDDVLDLSKIEAGKLEIRASPSSLRELADGVVAVFSQNAANKRLSLTSEIDPTVPTSVMLDAARLRQMLFNLVGNAVKYTDQGCVMLRIHAEPNADDPQLLRCVFEVYDTGMGIAQEEMQRIFEPFVQSEAGRALPREGTG
ncbi:MAG TPA: histidine kinase dimerization/phospho-acceptor domain-containing protein, partial [Solimonas sp.]|nr:histidine kinase dimerization/phospho-acceptor domain-containing protein [Solimonas sp.]